MNHRVIFAISAVIVAGFGSAQAAAPKPDLIKIAVSSNGLDLNSTTGVDSFKHRMKVAALKVCMESAGIDNTLAGESLLDDCVRSTVKAAIGAAPASLQTSLLGKTR